jgi:hypothetical protein
VSATVGGIIIAASILELVPLGPDRIYRRSRAGMRAASSPEERGAHALIGLAAVAFGGVWVVAGVAAADFLLPNFDVSGLRAYIGTIALVFAANWAIALPLILVRKWRR